MGYAITKVAVFTAAFLCVAESALAASSWTIGKAESEITIVASADASVRVVYRICHDTGPGVTVETGDTKIALPSQGCVDFVANSDIVIKRKSPGEAAIVGSYDFLDLAVSSGYGV